MSKVKGGGPFLRLKATYPDAQDRYWSAGRYLVIDVNSVYFKLMRQGQRCKKIDKEVMADILSQHRSDDLRGVEVLELVRELSEPDVTSLWLEAGFINSPRLRLSTEATNLCW